MSIQLRTGLKLNWALDTNDISLSIQDSIMIQNVYLYLLSWDGKQCLYR